VTVATRTPLLYVSGATWAASSPPGSLAPLGGTHADAAAADWPAVAARLRERCGPVPVQVVLSARLCRFVALPWLPDCWAAKALRAHVDAAFAAVGVAPAAHRIEIDWPAYGEPILAVAFPRASVEAIAAALLGQQLVLAGVEASLGPVLRRVGAALGAGPSLLAYAEDDGIAALALDGGRVVQVETLAGDGGGLDDIGAWSARRRMAYADDRQLRWLGATPAPDRFAGTTLAAPGVAAASAGQALVESGR
jgi:hypothetical protein